MAASPDRRSQVLQWFSLIIKRAVKDKIKAVAFQKSARITQQTKEKLGAQSLHTTRRTELRAFDKNQGSRRHRCQQMRRLTISFQPANIPALDTLKQPREYLACRQQFPLRERDIAIAVPRSSRIAWRPMASEFIVVMIPQVMCQVLLVCRIATDHCHPPLPSYGMLKNEWRHVRPRHRPGRVTPRNELADRLASHRHSDAGNPVTQRPNQRAECLSHEAYRD